MASYIINFLISSVLLYKYSTLFGIVFISALILPFPVNTLLMAVGSLIPQGYFHFTSALAVALIANVLGDCAGYALTKLYGRQVIRKLKLNNVAYFVNLEKYVRRHERMAVFLTRFVTSLGSIVNFLCGLVDVPFQIFLIYDVLGNLINAVFFLVLGYFVRDYWETLSGFVGGIGGICIIVLIALATWRIQVERNRA